MAQLIHDEHLLTVSQGVTRLQLVDKTHRNYAGHFVYANDAEDLKRHSFFHGIPWENMQDYYPPFIPRVYDWEDTKYFDDDDSISDIDSATTSEGVPAEPRETTQASPSNHQQEAQGIVPATPIDESAGRLPSSVLNHVTNKKTKEKKRPRDKILRDANCGKMAMQMRKESAFIGYEYRKGKTISEVIEEALIEEAGNPCGIDDGIGQIELNNEL